LGVGLFLGLFALDAFSESASGRAFLAFVVHLIPAFLLFVLVAVSWTREWLGGIAFITLAVAYAATVGARHPDWVAAISGPLFVVGGLYLWSWRWRAHVHTP
jgi:hypothetical protein